MLATEHFAQWMRAVHGADPFPWQQRLLENVVAAGQWPRLLDLPTGSGKTTALDVALFHLALDSDSARRTAPRRIVLVVDRRVVVAQAHTRATAIAAALRDSTDQVAKEVSRRLAALSRGGQPLQVAELRGGIARDESWARAPDQPAILTSTVDQVGSRLLFRGYGVSRSMQPVHAALLGNDTLWLLDEVHLSQPFAQTLDAVASRYRGWADVNVGGPVQVVHLSATAAAGEESRFRLAEADLLHAKLRLRLRAAKPVSLESVKATGTPGQRTAKLAARLAQLGATHARRFAVSAIVVNRVATARETGRLLRAELEDAADVVLVTGRMRPVDRATNDTLLERAKSGRDRAATSRPLVVVATQTIEAGADYDFDALITECASLDALKQRFGRLNRLGEAAECAAIVVIRDDHRTAKSVDPVYGPALARTWAWLESLPQPLDLGVLAFPQPEHLDELVAPRSDAPVMLPAHLDSWSQTSQPCQPEPDISLWLHGPDRGAPEVNLVWRADIEERHFVDLEALAGLLPGIELAAPSTLEALAVPLHAARAWLEGAAEAPVADVEGAAIEAYEDLDDVDHRCALAWRGAESVVVGPRDIRPGDTLIIPSTRGGLSDGTWDPTAIDYVADRGDECASQRRGRVVIRLHPAVLSDHGASDEARLLATQLSALVDDDVDDREHLVDALISALQRGSGWLAAATKGLTARRVRIVRYGANEQSLALISTAKSGSEAIEVTTEDDSSSFSGVEVTLGAHMRGVASWATGFASRLSLDPQLQRALELAGRWHDAGKADPRFQKMLVGGSEFRAATLSEPLAKSRVPAPDRLARERARLRSGYPERERHELLSVRLMESSPHIRAEAADEWDLVRHLVESHHGHCRPFAPVTFDDAPIDVELRDAEVVLSARSDHGMARLDSGAADRFFELQRRFGWWGLAYLEAILRLADHRRSEAEQEGAT